jgi:hypothetical protein
MQTRRWVNQSQPQTLQIAVFLLYFNAVLAALALLTDPIDETWLMIHDFRPLVRLVLLAALVGAGYLIANERKIGYPLGIAAAAFPIVIRLWAARKYHIDIFDLGMLFDVALVALLLHPQSREYQRIWFK